MDPFTQTSDGPGKQADISLGLFEHASTRLVKSWLLSVSSIFFLTEKRRRRREKEREEQV